ncbi:MAG: DNA cytosine methyltransferase [Planctomycetaceae bacterium]
MEQIPVIDLFAGPGGLGEGFSACRVDGFPPFRVALSIEKDPVAHATLELRAFFLQFPQGEAPEDYYRHVRDPRGFSREELFARWPREAERARREAWLAELGATDNDEIDTRVREALGTSDRWVLVGGPPCQAYSLVGRSRRGGIRDDDARVHLYKEYLRILAVHQPPVFVMENVKGLLSSRLVQD